MQLSRHLLFLLLITLLLWGGGKKASFAADVPPPTPTVATLAAPLPETVTPVDAAGLLDGIPPITSGQVVTAPRFTAPQATIPQQGLQAGAAPTIQLWYGNYQRFGVIGHPVPLINLLGTVTPAANLATLQFTVNGGAAQSLNWGPDNQRLAEAGDFNIEINRTTLTAGLNTVVITAVTTANEVATATVTVDYFPDRQWPQSYIADWGSTTNLQDLAQVIDGKWALQNGTLKPVVFDYDRLVAMGDQQWTSYEVSVPITVHAIDMGGFSAPSNGPGIGMILRWPGHYSDAAGEQPLTGWRELGGLGWYRWGKDKTNNNAIIVAQQLLGHRGRQLAVNENRAPAFDVPYIFKMSIQPVAARGDLYRFKVWEAANPEPLAWDMVANNVNTEPLQGSLVLLAHHVDATFGTVTVRPIDQIQPQVIATITGQGTVQVTPAGPYRYGQTVTVNAVAAPGFTFASWSGDVSSPVNGLSVELTKDVLLTANFAQSGSTTLTTATVGSGTVERNPLQATYGIGQQVVLTATAAAGWSFVGWSGDLTGTANPATVTMTADQSITATFAQALHTLTTATVGNGVITITPAKPQYAAGEVVTLTPVPAAGWRFQGWSGDLSGTTVPGTVTMNGDRQVTATFVEATYTVTVGQQGEGTVTVAPPAASYRFGDQVTLTATPAAGWRFQGWSGALSGTANPVLLTVDGDKTVTATFVQSQYNLTLALAGSGSGTVVANPAGPYYAGQTVTVTATPAAGARFVGWQGGATANPLVITINGNQTVTAIFDQQTYQITTQALDAAGAPLDSTLLALSPPANGNGYVFGEQVTVIALPPQGWTFQRWQGAAQGALNPTSVTVQGDLTITGIFAPLPPDSYTLTLTSNNPAAGVVTVEPSGPYLANQEVTLTVTLTPGWEFTGWSGDLSGQSQVVVITMNRNKTVAANFAELFYTVTVSPVTGQGGGGGTVDLSPAGPYRYGDQVTLTAIPAPGYQFERWSTAANTISDRAAAEEMADTENPLTVEIKGDIAYTAHFSAQPPAYQLFLPLIIRRP